MLTYQAGACEVETGNVAYDLVQVKATDYYEGEPFETSCLCFCLTFSAVLGIFRETNVGLTLGLAFPATNHKGVVLRPTCHVVILFQLKRSRGLLMVGKIASESRLCKQKKASFVSNKGRLRFSHLVKAGRDEIDPW